MASLGLLNGSNSSVGTIAAANNALPEPNNALPPTDPDEYAAWREKQRFFPNARVNAANWEKFLASHDSENVDDRTSPNPNASVNHANDHRSRKHKRRTLMDND